MVLAIADDARPGLGNRGQALGCRDLSKAFGDRVAVDAVSFTVAPGDILALVGPSGCGKTTLLRLIAGFEQPDNGDIEIAGQTVVDARRHLPPERRRVGMVFQDYAVFPHLSVGRNVGFALGKGRAAEARVAELLDFVGLAGYEQRMPHELSGGEQQRVSLARALSTDPAVLLLDEPFSNLDAALRAGVRAEVRALLKQKGITAVFVTHDQEEALFLGDRVGVMCAGRLEQLGTPENIFHQPKTRFVAEFMGQTDFLPGVVVAAGVETAMGLVARPVALPAGTPVEIALRPDDVALEPDPTGNGRVLARRFIGMANVYQVGLASGAIVHSLQPHTRSLTEGDSVMVSLVGDHALPCFHEGRAI